MIVVGFSVGLIELTILLIALAIAILGIVGLVATLMKNK
jgi:hypothetical protein